MKKKADEKPKGEAKKPASRKVEKKPAAKKADSEKKPQKAEVKKANPTVKKPIEKKSSAKLEVKGAKLEEKKAPTKKAESPTAKKIEEKKKAPTKKAEKPTVKKPEEKKKATAKKEDFDDNINISETVAVTEGGSTRNGKFDIRRAKDGRFFFNLYASNYVVIAYSQMYSSTQSAMTGIKSVMANAAISPIEDTTLKKPTSLPFPKWEIYIDRAGEYRFRLYSSNGNCVCHSHGYSTKATCKGGIESIIRFSKESDISKSYKK